MDRKKIIRDLDRYYSQYVRLKASDEHGICTCYTSGVRDYWKNLDVGHFISRRYLPTRWELDNLRPQSRYDNRYLGGNLQVYKNCLTRELGAERVDELYRQARSGRKLMTYELMEMLARIKADWENLLEERKQNGWKC